MIQDPVHVLRKNQFILTGKSRKEIEQKIDAFLSEEKPFKALVLILPVGATRFEYRGLHIRKWLFSDFKWVNKGQRFDCAIELLGDGK